MRAASVVRAFASVAIRMPMFPASAEKIAPTMNAGTIIQCVVSTTAEMPNSATLAMTTNIASRRYSADKKAKAPSLMFFEISIILSFPGFCFLTQIILKIINSSPTTESAIGRKIKSMGY